MGAIQRGISWRRRLHAANFDTKAPSKGTSLSWNERDEEGLFKAKILDDEFKEEDNCDVAREGKEHLTRAEMPFFAGASHLDHEEEIQCMREMLDDIEQGRKRKAPESNYCTPDYLFTKKILETSLLQRFHLPQLENYDGTIDPKDHGIAWSCECHMMQSLSHHNTKSSSILVSSLESLFYYCFTQVASLFEDLICDCEKGEEIISAVDEGLKARRIIKKYLKWFHDDMMDMKSVSIDIALATCPRCQYWKIGYQSHY